MILGVDVPGCFAVYVKLPVKAVWETDPQHPAAHRLPPGADGQRPCTPSTRGTWGTKAVLVNGCGPFGLFAVGIARALGAAMIVAVEPNKFRGDLGEDDGRPTP